MTKEFLYNFIRTHRFGVLATVSPDHAPESAYVGIAVTPDLEIVFDTVSDSRKYQNLLLNPRIAFVIGWDDEQTVQYEGIANIPDSKGLEKLLQTYFAAFPDGIDRKENWKNIAYFSVKPKWIRYSNYKEGKQQIEELKF